MILTPLYDSNFALKMRVFGKSTLIVAFFLCCTFLRPSTGGKYERVYFHFISIS